MTKPTPDEHRRQMEGIVARAKHAHSVVSSWFSIYSSEGQELDPQERATPPEDGLQEYFLSHINKTDYVVVRGQMYKVDRDDFGSDVYFVEVDEIPDEYWQRWCANDGY